MTMEEIIKHAEETFKIEPTDCKSERRAKQYAQRLRIEKLAIKYGHLQKKELNS